MKMKSVSEMTIKELQDIATKIEKYEDVHKRYVEIAKELNEMGERILAFSRQIDPVSVVGTRAKNNLNLKSYMNEMYDKMRAGTQVTAELLENTYPDCNKKQIAYLITLLGKLKGVDKARDGIRVRLFIR